MVEYFDYQAWQLKNHVKWGEKFIFFRGPRFGGKSYFARNAFEELNVPYIYIDVAGIRKTKKPRTNFFETVKKDLYGLQKHVKTNIEGLRFPNCRYVRCFLKRLEDRGEDVYVIFDHAELLYPWETYGRIFRGVIDHYRNVHLVLVPASTPMLINKSGIYDPEKPLFARWEKYVDFEYWGAGDVKRYLENEINDISDNEIWYIYELTEGAPQLVMKYAKLRRTYSMDVAVGALKKYVREKVLEEISGSEWKKKILKAIAEETGGGRYTRLKVIQNVFDKYNKSSIMNRFFDQIVLTGYIYFLGEKFRLRPNIVSGSLVSITVQ